MGSRIREREGSESIRLTLSAPLPAVLLGVPIEGAENPVIVGSVREISIEVEAKRCDEPRAGSPSPMLNEVISSIMTGIGINACVKLHTESTYEEAQIGPQFVASMYAIYRLHGDKPRAEDLVDLWRISREVPPEWRVVEEALIYASASGGIHAYRGVEETYIIGRAPVPAELAGLAEAKAAARREELGEDVYGSMIRLMGITVLRAAEDIREAGIERIAKYLPIHRGIAYIVWGLAPDMRCIWSPSMNMKFVRLCFRNALAP